MKSIALAIAAVLGSAGMVIAGDLDIAKVTLDSMGLGAMQSLSDQDGMTVRGKGPLEVIFGESTFPGLGGVDSGQNPSSGFSGNFQSPSNPLDRSQLTLDGHLPGSAPTTPGGPSFSDFFGTGSITNFFPSPLQ